MATKLIASCVECGYPVAVQRAGQRVSCANCGTVNEAIATGGAVNEAITQGVTIPGWLFGWTIGSVMMLVLGPSLIASTEAGSKWLAEKAREKLAR